MDQEASDRRYVRQKVEELLQRTTDLKRLGGAGGDALKQAEKAYRLAHGNSGLGQPWLAVTAYRRAMLLLRTQDLPLETLRLINDLLLEAVIASEDRPDLELGPWAQLYRLPVLHRIRILAPDPERDREIAEAFRDCAGFLDNPEMDVESSPGRSFRLHTQAYNCMELAGLFLGMNLVALEGRGMDADLLPMARGFWYLFDGSNALYGALWGTKGMALTELATLIELTPNAYGFVHPASEGSQGELWGPGGARKIVSSNHTAVLKNDLAIPRTFGGPAPQARTYRARCKDDLAALMGVDVSSLAAPGGGIRIPEGITLFGAVEHQLG